MSFLSSGPTPVRLSVVQINSYSQEYETHMYKNVQVHSPAAHVGETCSNQPQC